MEAELKEIQNYRDNLYETLRIELGTTLVEILDKLLEVERTLILEEGK